MKVKELADMLNMFIALDPSHAEKMVVAGHVRDDGNFVGRSVVEVRVGPDRDIALIVPAAVFDEQR